MSRLRRGLAIQGRNIRALMVRDMMMRYGRGNIGFVWIVLEPMLLTVGVMVVWSYTIGPQKQGVKLVELVLTGYMMLTLWRHVTNSAITIFRRSSGLLYHRTISLFDILLARGSLEFVATATAFLVVWGTLYLAGLVGPVERYDLLFAGWIMMGGLALACSAVIAAVTEWSEAAERIIQPLQYISLPVSGAFFMVDWLPTWAQKAVLLNPMVHCYETFRAGYFGHQVVSHYDFGYFAVWLFGLTFVGVVSVRLVRDRVALS
ncbi:ABC transporter permease [Reyranella sp.]|uniref:ABC transporter permease n=1 Tax=Reyranella sp. TaxID=1929291 RepID=UPI003BAC233D